MEVKQIAGIVNTIQQEVLGESAIVAEDLSQVVDIGNALMSNTSYDKLTGKLVDHIGRVIFANRPYRGKLLSVYRDGWEFGGALEKVRTRLMPAQDDESWQLTDGQVYETNKYTQPAVSAKFYNMRTTFEHRVSIADKQVKSAFSGQYQLDGFFSMLETGINNNMALQTENLIKRAINNMTAGAIHAGGARAVNLLAKYNAATGAALTAANALRDKEFLRYAATVIDQTQRRMEDFNAIYNASGAQNHTPRDLQHLVMHDSIIYALDNYLRADVYHERLLAMPYGEIITNWQGIGSDYDWAATTSIDVKANLPDADSPTVVKQSGILAVLFDHEAVMVCNEDPRVTSHYVASAEFTNIWHKRTAGYLNDFDESFVVFFIAD